MLKKNTYHNVTVTDMNDLGYGVARIDGIVVFVDGGVTGDELEIKIIKAAKDYGVARTEKIITPSPYRVSPDCAVFPRCGGCSFRHISREYELELKRNIVVSAFRKNGIDAKVGKVLTDGKVSGYRNKAQYPIDENGNIGYYARHSHTVIPCDKCDLTAPELSEIASFVSDYIKSKKWCVKHIYLRIAEKTGQIMTCLVTPNESLDGEKEFAEELTARFPNVVSVLLNIHPEETNVILGKKTECAIGQDYIEEDLLNKTFKISSNTFFQVNPKSAENIFNYVKDFIQANYEKPIVLDAYAGISTFGICLSDVAKKVVTVEEVKASTDLASKIIKENGIKNVEIHNMDAGKFFEKELNTKGRSFDVTVLDPPRKGCTQESLDYALKLTKGKIIYVSCNPATLARDLKYLVEKGCKVEFIQPFDMFPHTYHIENVAVISI